MKNYDVIIIGAGIAGIFSALRLTKDAKKILLIDIGSPLTDRLRQLGSNIASNRSSQRYFGFGGLGLSEGKYNFTNDFGGNLALKIGAEQSMVYQHQVDKLLCQFGAVQCPLYDTYDEDLAHRANKYGFKTLTTQTRHLGTSLSISILQAFANELTSKIDFIFNCSVLDIIPQNKLFKINLTNHNTIISSQVIIAVGRSGLDWFEPIAQQLKLSYGKTQLDLGFRIEMHNQQLQSLLQKSFETKLIYQTKQYSASTYCMNPRGNVIAKYQAGLVMPDGQNAREVDQSHNLNFTLFIPKWFEQRQAADAYLKQTITKINQGKNKIIMQRLANIDRRFSDKKYVIEPTLAQAEFANLATFTPMDYIIYTCDFLYALAHLLGEPIDGNTILYAMDSKTYAPVVHTDQYFMSEVKGLYIIGDCSGVTSSLSQAAASGLYVADQINKTSSFTK